MDLLISVAARALAAGAPLEALNHIALRNDAPALALRGVAMAQLGDLVRAKALLRSASRAFGPANAVARARCQLAEAEIALVSRELDWPAKALRSAQAVLQAHGDWANATHAQYLAARRLVLIGRVDEAESILGEPQPKGLPPALHVVRNLAIAGIATRRLQITAAHHALVQAGKWAHLANIPPLAAEVELAIQALHSPAAQSTAGGQTQTLDLFQVEALLASTAFIVDACRHTLCQSGLVVSLARRPVLFALARCLSEAWPKDVPRDTLIARAFRMKMVDDTHRARLRVEMSRLRKTLSPLADVRATPQGFILAPHDPRKVAMLTRPDEDRHGAVLALLSDGEAWSSSALALALGISQRTVQRALDSLHTADKIQSLGRGRSRRWVTPPLPGFTTTLLLPIAPGFN